MPYLRSMASFASARRSSGVVPALSSSTSRWSPETAKVISSNLKGLSRHETLGGFAQEVLAGTSWKKIGSSAATKVHDTKDELSMCVEVPDKYKNAPEGYTREFYLGRAHDGIASKLANTSKVKVGFSSSKFSTYALAYKDTKIPESDPGKDDKKGKGGAKTGDPIDIAGLLALMLAAGLWPGALMDALRNWQ